MNSPNHQITKKMVASFDNRQLAKQSRCIIGFYLCREIMIIWPWKVKFNSLDLDNSLDPHKVWFSISSPNLLIIMQKWKKYKINFNSLFLGMVEGIIAIGHFARFAYIIVAIIGQMSSFTWFRTLAYAGAEIFWTIF